jgi:lipopolysaccharide transport system ATP-binding protein
MSDLAIRAENLSKRYRIGARQEKYRTLRDTVSDTVTGPFRSLRSKLNGSRAEGVKHQNEIWALKDLNFEIKHGDVVGIIGRNGAGKSTLLKILARITEPASGYADVHGRVGSLLEVGTGFHQELTGRENIYLNGAIIGMKKAEIDRTFDEIVAFAEVEKFIDTPVKRFSSGMYLRLAFSVAAHLESEILLVDEVLAVGDVAFQRKCLGKLGDVAATGRTVLFVSHNLGVIKEHCRTSLVLKNGAIDFRGPVVEGLAHYSQTLMESGGDSFAGSTGWREIQINGKAHGLGNSFASSDELTVEVLLELRDEFVDGRLFCIINDTVGNSVVHQRMYLNDLIVDKVAVGRHRLRVELPALWLAPGVYSLYFKFMGTKANGDEEKHFSERAMLDLTGSVVGLGRAQLAPPLKWELNPEPVLQYEDALST